MASLALALAVGAAAALERTAIAQGPAGAPNIVVVQTDDQAYESLRFMDTVKSRIRDAGTTFTQDTVNWPVCCPSRATLLTGQYAHNHGVLGNSPPNGGVTSFDDSESLAVWLADDSGPDYTTAHIGKYLNHYGESAPGSHPAEDPRYVPPGWDEWHTAAREVQHVYGYTLNRNGSLVDYGERRQDFKQDVFSDIAVQLIESHVPDAKPLYLQVDYTAPHGAGRGPNPHPPQNCDRSARPAPRHAHSFDRLRLPRPESFNERNVSDKPAAIRNLPRLDGPAIAEITRAYRCRAESLLSVDEGVDQILDALTAEGELGNTLVIFTADNGYFHGEHRVPNAKGKVYDAARRVPLMMRGPGVPGGQVSSRPVTNADLAPTIADASGAVAGLEPDGASLLPLAADPPSVARRALLLETSDYTAVRTSRYVWAEHKTGERELYDLDRDPDELRSRHDASAYADARAALQARLAQLRACEGAACSAVSDYTDGP